MAEGLITWFVLTVMVGTLLLVFIPTFDRKRMGYRHRGVQRSGDRRRGIMDKIAGFVVMSLGRFTIAILHLFEILGVDMSAFDEALARLTAFTSAQASSLREAQSTITAQHAEIDRLVSEDATQDQIQIADAVKTALDEAAAQLDTVTTNLENPPAEADLPDVPVDVPPSEDPGTAPVTEPGPPQTPPSSDTPVADTPVVGPGDPANVPPESIPDPTPVTPVEGDGPLDPSLPVTPVDATGEPVTDTPAEPAPTEPAPVDPTAPADPASPADPTAPADSAAPVDPSVPADSAPVDPAPADPAPADTPVGEPVVNPVDPAPAADPTVTDGTTGQ